MRHRQHNPHDPEAGYLLLGVVVLCALVLIALAVAAPVVARDLRRDKEVESQHRAEQYTRAIRLYYRKNKSYPPSMEALEKSNNIRFLRQKYPDPITGKNDWRIIHVGQNQTTVKGFFGKPLAGIASAGLGSAAGLQSTTGGSTAGTPGTAPTTVTGSGLSAGFAGATIGGTQATPGSTPAPGTPDTSSGSLDSLNGGGGPIMGVGTSRTGDSVTEPNEQTTYETWEFLYDPRIEQLYALSNLLGGGGFGVAGAGTATGTNIGGNSNGGNTDTNNPNNPAPPSTSSGPGLAPGNNTPSAANPNGQ